jgi:hypothetical protein
MSNPITINKDPTSNNTYQISFHTNLYSKTNNNTKIIIQTLFHSKILQPHTSTITDEYRTLIIKANTLTNYEDFLMKQYHEYTQKQFENKKYEIALQMINTLMKQLKSLFHYKYTFYAFSLENIFVIDNQYFIYLNPDHLLPFDLQTKTKINTNINTNNENPIITLKIPFQRGRQGLFLSPEIQTINQLPFSISYKTIYYSLGCLIIYFLFEKEITISTFTNDKSIEILKSIKETKLYWFLLRVMKTDPAERWLYY